MGVPTRTEHDYRVCRDAGCQRFACRVYKEGFRDGFQAGRVVGEADGYAAGFADGIAACPGPHGG